MKVGNSNQDVLFSIIIPVYNASKYLQKSFDSLKEFYNAEILFEIIYVNDGSTDDSLDIITSISQKNHNIKVISQANQEGSSITRNNGLAIASGKFVQFIDSDDFIDCKLIIEAIFYSLKHDLDANSVQLEFADKEGVKIGDAKKFNLTYNKVMSGREALMGYMPSSICVFVFKRKFLCDNNLKLYPNIVNMDVEFSVRMLILAQKVHFYSRSGYSYVQTDNSIKRTKSVEKVKKNYRDQILVAKLIYDNILVNKMDAQLRARIIELSNNTAWNAIYGLLVTERNVEKLFILDCIEFAKNNYLYPIKGPLSTNFQKLTSFFLNNNMVVQLMLLRKNQ